MVFLGIAAQSFHFFDGSESFGQHFNLDGQLVVNLCCDVRSVLLSTGLEVLAVGNVQMPRLRICGESLS